MTQKLFLKVSYVETFYEDFLEITSYPCKIGRDPSSPIVLMGQEISRDHAELVEVEGKIRMRDLGSNSGIWSHGKKVKDVEIVENSQFRIGAAILTFSFIHFPLEQTISYGHIDDAHDHEPILKRLESLLEGKLAFILFFALLALSYLTAPDLYRKSDSFKNLISSLFNSSFVAPIIFALLIVIVRKINRNEYSWNRSLCMSYILCIAGEVFELFERSLCWFTTFNMVWNSIVLNILKMMVFFFWWFFAVGKDSSLMKKFVRSAALASVTYALIMGVQLLATGYSSEFELESCDSLTGWHWGEGIEVSSLAKFVTDSAKELSK